MADDKDVDECDMLTGRFRALVEQLHAEGYGPQHVVAAMTYELGAEIAFGIVSAGHPAEAVPVLAAEVIADFSDTIQRQITTFGTHRHP